jgi:hypothetical protein
MAAGIPIFVEGDSNTGFSYDTLNWMKWVLMLSGFRVWLPPGAYTAMPGAAVTDTGNGLSMTTRLSTVLANMDLYPGQKIMWFQIGTNAEPGQTGSYAAITELASLVASYRSKGCFVIANTTPYNTSLSNQARLDTLNAWIRTPGNVDAYLDVNTGTAGTSIVYSMGRPDTHYSDAQHLAVGTAGAALLSSLVQVGTPWSGTPGGNIFFQNDLTGFTTKTGTGFSGVYPANWTPTRTVGADGSLVGTETTQSGQPAMQLTVSCPAGAAANCTYRVRRVLTVSRAAGAIIDSFLRVGFTASDNPVIAYVGMQMGNGAWPNGLVAGLDYPFPEGTGPLPWRTYAEPLPAAVTSLNLDIFLTARPGTSATFVFSEIVLADKGSNSVVAPAALTAPVMSRFIQNQTPLHTAGTYSGTPTPSVSAAYYLDGNAIAGSYVLAAGDVGKPLLVTETALNIGGSVSQNSATVNVTAASAPGITGTPQAATTVTAAYSFVPTISGGTAPYTCNLTGSLPAGLSFNSTTGAITGNTSATGTFTGLNITVTDNLGQTGTLGVFSITVNALPALSGTPASTITVGQTYNFTPTTTGGTAPFTYALTGTPPAGTAFNTSTGQLTGVVTTAATYAGLNITVTDARGVSASLGTFSVTVNAAAGLAEWDTSISSGTPAQVAYPTVRKAQTSANTVNVKFGRASTTLRGKSTGKWCFRLRFGDTPKLGRSGGWGTVTTGSTAGGVGGTLGSQRWQVSNNVIQNGSNTTLGYNVGTTNIDVDFYVDLDADLFWIRPADASFPWNSNASADPVAGTIGLAFNHAGALVVPMFGLPATTDLTSVEIIDTGTPLSGYTQWN